MSAVTSLAIAAGFTLSGCGAAHGASLIRGSGERIGASDFTQGDDAPAPLRDAVAADASRRAAARPPSGSPVASLGRIRGTESGVGTDGTAGGTAYLAADGPAGRSTVRPRLVARPGTPGPGPSNPRATAPAELVESKVGSINGKPLYAGSFLGPLAPRIEAEARRSTPAEWSREATGIIGQQLTEVVSTELLRAEATSTLEPEQEAGLRFFLQQTREDLASRFQGSAALADARLREDRGIDTDEFLRQTEEEILIATVLAREVRSRVEVTWRDIVRRYQRDLEKYNPGPTARLRAVRTIGEEPTEAVVRRLAEASQTEGPAGARRAFIDIAASDLNTFEPARGGLIETQFEGAYAEAAIFPNDQLNAAATALAVGEISPPVPRGGVTWFLFLEEIDERSVSLYDAQREIAAELGFERRTERRQEYLNDLIRRASVDSVDEMVERLFEVAARWHGPAAVAERDVVGSQTGGAAPSGLDSER